MINKIDKLTYIKYEFLKNFKLNLHTHYPDDLIDPLISFFKNFPQYRKEILNAHSKENLLDIFQNINEKYTQSLGIISHTHCSVSKVLRNYYHYIVQLDSIKEWMENTEVMYDDKVKHEIPLLYEDSIEKFIDNCNILENSSTIKEKTKELMDKYNLAYFDLSQIPNVDFSLNFLNKFDIYAEKMTQDMNMPLEYLGIKSTVGIHYNSNNYATYTRIVNRISLDVDRILETTILHEWIHALDSYINKNHTGNSKFTSHNEEIIFNNNEDDENGRAFYLMRQLTQNILSYNNKEVKKIIEEKTRQGLSKFWSVIIGSEWYSIPKEKRNNYFNNEAKQVVINYLANPGQYSLNALKLYINNYLPANNEDFSKKIEDNKKYLEENITPYFKEINANFIGKKSLYFRLSQLADCQLNIYRLKNKVIDYILGNNLNKTLISSKQNYYTKPCEMLARYFQSQLYHKKPLLSEIVNLDFPYRLTIDKDFEEKKDNILDAVFQPTKTLNTILKFRKKFDHETLEKLSVKTNKESQLK